MGTHWGVRGGPRGPPLPDGKGRLLARNAFDRFLQRAAWRPDGHAPSPEARRPTLVLPGEPRPDRLPPSPEAVGRVPRGMIRPTPTIVSSRVPALAPPS